MNTSRLAVEAFRYVEHVVDAAERTVRCRYALDDLEFEERISVDSDGDWSSPAVAEAARLVFLLAGVSYYKAAAPPVIDLGTTPVRDGEREFLTIYYREGLGEFAHRNDLTLELAIVGGVPAGPPAPYRPTTDAPLVPFGGGIDSIVTVEEVRRTTPDIALFVVSRLGDRFAAIEDAAAVAALPIVRAGRELDPKILRSSANGYLNGHVPVTAIVSSIALLAAVLEGRDAVVMSNEWSASMGNLEIDGRSINHQYSKSAAFEGLLRDVLANAFDAAPEYFSYLRPYSELWVAQRFAELREYHPVFRSCNRAFHIDPAARLDHWCGVCDKCCFIDLVLAPFVPAADLAAVFDGREPLDDPALLGQFRTLVGLSPDVKPWECVGDVGECQVSVVLAGERIDRAGNPTLATIEAELGDRRPTPASAERYLEPMGPTFAPERHAHPRPLG